MDGRPAGGVDLVRLSQTSEFLMRDELAAVTRALELHAERHVRPTSPRDPTVTIAARKLCPLLSSPDRVRQSSAVSLTRTSST